MKGTVQQGLMSNVVQNEQLKALTAQTDKMSGILDDLKMIQELQTTLNLLIDQAGPVLDKLEATYEQIEDNVAQGKQNVKKARSFQVGRLKIIIIVSIVVLIALGVGGYFIYKSASE